FQITQEYLGQGTHLVYEAPLFKEVLQADTYKNGKGSTVSSNMSGIAGVANIGNERNWTNHPFAQANWYAFGRLAWDPALSSEQIADEWIRQTFSNNDQVVTTAKKMMIASREAVVNYMTPLGLAHMFLTGHHYGPGPWISNTGRADWNPVYYHRADSIGIGFDRTASGSNALKQYAPEIRNQFASTNTIPEKYLLWFHRLPWNFRMRSGKTLWNELCFKYQLGVDTTRWMRYQWVSLEDYIDEERYRQVKMFLDIQVHDAIWWKNACLLYFQTFSKMQIPVGVEKPNQTLEYYQNLKFPFAPGN
ncbi:MAG TPA: hypothetical protein VJT83_08020, partial [Chitinophagaceae bacterium]|nr:hypothetical protein [Chitinophagaceae bacterium]